MFIDPHVHCRDEEESYKETIAHALSVAERVGFTAIFDIPNLKPNPVIDRQSAVERLTLAANAKSPVKYGMYILLTPDPRQIKEAVSTYNEFKFDSERSQQLGNAVFIAGLKEFCGCDSVGPSSVKTRKDRQLVNQVLSDEGYASVKMTHCEEELQFCKEIWNPEHPASHSFSRPSSAEVQCISDEIQDCIDAKFKGVLHITHISVPGAVDLVDQARSSLRIACGVTPHHILFDRERMDAPDGLLYKMNPPLRGRGLNAAMLCYLKEGKIDWIETDHAPHTLDEKLKSPYMSGIPGLAFYPLFVMRLKGHGFSEEQIRGITFNNICRSFGLILSPREVSINSEVCKEMAKEYAFDPYKELYK